jgi:hypothetical protein
MHGNDDIEPMRRLGMPKGLGGTGRYPDGKLGPDDEGEITTALAVDRARNRILLAFGEPVAWVSMTGPEARAFALNLLDKAKQIGG